MIENTRQELYEWEQRWEAEEQRNRAVREAWLQQMELEHYQELDEEQRKREARESHLYALLEAVEEELRTGRATAVDAED